MCTGTGTNWIFLFRYRSCFLFFILTKPIWQWTAGVPVPVPARFPPPLSITVSTLCLLFGGAIGKKKFFDGLLCVYQVPDPVNPSTGTGPLFYIPVIPTLPIFSVPVPDGSLLTGSNSFCVCFNGCGYSLLK